MRLGDPSLFIDHVRDAARVLIGRTLARAVRQADLALGVADEWEGKVELLREPLVLFVRVEADADDLRVLRFVLFDEVPEPGTLNRSTGCVGLGIEPENDLLAAKAVKRNRVAVVVDGIEIRSGITGLQHARSSSKELFPKVASGST
jgi:hypothetical protein